MRVQFNIAQSYANANVFICERGFLGGCGAFVCNGIYIEAKTHVSTKLGHSGSFVSICILLTHVR